MHSSCERMGARVQTGCYLHGVNELKTSELESNAQIGVHKDGLLTLCVFLCAS